MKTPRGKEREGRGGEEEEGKGRVAGEGDDADQQKARRGSASTP